MGDEGKGISIGCGDVGELRSLADVVCYLHSISVDGIDSSPMEYGDRQAICDIYNKNILNPYLAPYLTPFRFNHICSLLSNRVHTTHDIPADIIWEDRSIRNP